MSGLYVYQQCPNCDQKALFFSLSIYRCRVCLRFCCDRCVGKGKDPPVCPHCQTRASVVQVGYTL
jgi:hypothetical protein